MMIAELRPRCSLPISSRMNGNFCTVEMAALDEPAQIARAVGVPTVACPWAYCRIVSWICRSRMRRSVTTMIESNTGALQHRPNQTETPPPVLE